MSDIIDNAQEQAQRWNDLAVSARAKLPYTRATNRDCLECGEPISPARREAAPHAACCVECQSHIERFAR